MVHEQAITTVAEYVRLVRSNSEYGCLYRGVTRIGYKLLPSVGRYLDLYLRVGKTKADLLSDEQKAFRIFYSEAVAHGQDFGDCYWNWLGLAQQHGLATRLLDWSYSPLAALFFAVCRPSDADSCVYVASNKIVFISRAEEGTTDPYKITALRAFMPEHITPRLRAQSGLFTIHPDPTVAMTDGIIGLVRVPNAARGDIKLELNHLGVHDKSLFPDIDGLGRWIRWMKFDCLER